MKNETKAEVSGGVAVSVSVVSLGLLILFIWSPAVHYLGKWGDYWDRKDQPVEHHVSVDDQIQADKWSKANDDCRTRTAAYFRIGVAWAEASSTNDNSYTTYDCYGVKFTKIP